MKTIERRGLSEAEVRRSRAEHGANVMTKQKRKGFFGHFISNLGDPVIKILLGALAVKLILLFRESDKLETFGIAAAVVLATMISTLSEYGSARAFERLSEESANVLCRVRRGGAVMEIPLREIVVGDTVFDIEMGANAGTRTCGVTYGNGSRESLASATWIIDDFGQLLDIVK